MLSSATSVSTACPPPPLCCAAFGFEAGKPVELQCIRRMLPPGVQWRNQFYPAQCAATMDGGTDY